MKRRSLIIASSLALAMTLVVVLSATTVQADLESKQLNILYGLIESGNNSLARSYVALLLKESTMASRLDSALEKLHSAEIMEREQTEARWAQVNEILVGIQEQIDLDNQKNIAIKRDIDRLKQSLGLFRSEVNEYQNLSASTREQPQQADKPDDTNYLQRLIGETRVAANSLTIPQIKDKLLSARNLAARGNYNEVRVLATAILRATPEHWEAAGLYCLAMVAINPESDRLGEVLEVADMIRTRHAGLWSANAATGMALYSHGRYSEAEPLIDAAFQTMPDMPDLIRYRILVKEQNGKSQEVLELARNQWKKQASDENALTVWKLLSGDSAEQRELFLLEWMTRLPASYLPNVYLAELYLKDGRSDKALTLLTEASKKKPMKDLFRKLAELYAETGEYLPAITQYKRYLSYIDPAIRKNLPEYLLILERLIGLEQSLGLHDDLALHCEQYLAQSGSKDEILPVYGYALLKIGNRDAGIKQFENALARKIVTPEIIYCLEMLIQQKQYDLAQKIAHSSLDCNPVPTIQIQVTEILETITQLKKKAT